MSWLSDWLREIILVVLLAAFVELLLPSKSMERYARLVLSLLVLLTLLNPVVSFLKGDAVKELSVAMNAQEKQGGLFPGKSGGEGSLEKILADGRRLAQGRQEQSLKLAADEVAGQMRDQIAQATGIGGVRVTVSLAMGKPPGGGKGEEVPVIAAVTVALPPEQAVQGPDTPDNGDSSAAAAQPIEIPPVEAVEVTVGATPAPAAGRESSGMEKAKDAGSEQGKSILTLLKQQWNLDPETIHIQDASPGDKKL